MYVVKFRGAGQGAKTLVAEVIAGGLARGLGLPVPDLVTVDVDPVLAVSEPDQEVQDLLRASAGLNLGIDFLPGALDFEPTAFPVDAVTAGRVLWFDALVNNVDRTHRNPNMLHWHGLRLIDHGATLSFHHRWETAGGFVTRAYDAAHHALLDCSPDLVAAEDELSDRFTPDLVAAAVADVPAAWLVDDELMGDATRQRTAYIAAILDRFAARAGWLAALREQVAR